MQQIDAPDADDTILEPHEFSATAFTPEEKKVFEEALVIGFKEKTVEVFGHSVVIKTTSVREDLKVSSIIKPFEGTKGLVKAFKTATVAASLVSIDGEPFYTPIGFSDHDEIVNRKFEKLLDYYSIFVEEVFNHVTALAEEVEKSVVQKLGKSSG